MDSSNSCCAAFSSPSRTMNPPPTEKNVASRTMFPSASETANFIPFVCRGNTVNGCNTISSTAYGNSTP
ncbi:hypothetical protein D3C86_2162490 [compost metagenome]